MGRLVIGRPGITPFRAERIRAADARIRQQYTGEPAVIVQPIARQEFARAGIFLPPRDLFAYAESVWYDTDFVLRA
jgi:hypothetical protein